MSAKKSLVSESSDKPINKDLLGRLTECFNLIEVSRFACSNEKKAAALSSEIEKFNAEFFGIVNNSGALFSQTGAFLSAVEQFLVSSPKIDKEKLEEVLGNFRKQSEDLVIAWKGIHQERGKKFIDELSDSRDLFIKALAHYLQQEQEAYKSSQTTLNGVQKRLVELILEAENPKAFEKFYKLIVTNSGQLLQNTSRLWLKEERVKAIEAGQEITKAFSYAIGLTLSSNDKKILEKIPSELSLIYLEAQATTVSFERIQALAADQNSVDNMLAKFATLITSLRYESLPIAEVLEQLCKVLKPHQVETLMNSQEVAGFSLPVTKTAQQLDATISEALSRVHHSKK